MLRPSRLRAATRHRRLFWAAFLVFNLVFWAAGPLSRTADAHYFCQVWPYSQQIGVLSLKHWNQVSASTYPEFGDAIYNWNTSPTAAYFQYGDQYNWQVHSVNTDYGNTGWAGYTVVHGSCGSATDASVLLNDYFLVGYSYYARRHVEAHELGHALTLDHAPSGYASVMLASDYTYWAVAQHDIDDMNARYPR